MARTDKIAYENTGIGVYNTVQSIAGWSNDAYRQITLEKPATGNLLTWLEANAVRLPLTGTYVFNERLNGLVARGNWDIAFTSNDNSYSKFMRSSDSISYGSTMVYVIPSKKSPWINEAYRTITFTEPVQYQGNEEFVKWFTANAKPLPAKGKTLNEYTWDEISRISLADKAVEYGFKVGDAKEVTLNGSVGYGSAARTFSNQKYWVYIIGINHNEAKEGKGIAFQGFKTAQSGGIDIAVTATNYGSKGSGMVMNSTNTNSGGWVGSAAHKTIMPQWKACFPSDLQAVIRSTTLYADDVGNASTAASSVKASANEVYYLAEYEVFGSNHSANTNEPAQQVQYAYYAAGNSKVKYRSDSTNTAAIWWLRSTDCNATAGFCFVGTDGSAYYYNAFGSYGSAPCFKV